MPWKPQLIKVSVGIIINAQQQILIALRPPQVPEGNLWEFPGGKIEIGETPVQGLFRELYEEIGIQVQEALPFLNFCYDRSKRRVEIHSWIIKAFQGTPYGKEGQKIQWAPLQQLNRFSFPEANQLLISHLTILSNTKMS